MRKLVKLIDKSGNSSVILEPEYNGTKLDSINLKDKNGSEIFVGDILYYKNGNNERYYTVFEMPGGYCIEANPELYGLYDESMLLPCKATSDLQTSSFITRSLEVIGNKYSNPELYKKVEKLAKK